MLLAIKEGTDMTEVINKGTDMTKVVNKVINKGTDKTEAINKGMETRVVANKDGTEMEEKDMVEVCTDSGTTYPSLLQSSVTLRIHVTCVMAG